MALVVSAPNEFSKISEINSDKATWNFRAKIIRLWQVSDFNRNTTPFSIEMVLLDNDGGRIHATIKKTLIYKFKDELREGKVYFFENLSVASNGGAYRTTHHPYKLNFQFGSLVQRLSNFEIQRSPFEFVPISDIVAGSYDTDYLCDVIGVLKGVGQEREVTNQNGTTTKLNVIAIEQDGQQIQCTLFGAYVDELNVFLGAGDCHNVVVIVQFAKAKTFQDKIHIQNCLNCSVLIFNPNCAESAAIRASLAETVETPSPMTLTQINVEPRVEPIDEFLHNTPRITLQSLRDATVESFYVVAATVKRILNPDSFYYTACMCNKAVIPDSRLFYCEKCDKHVSRVVSRFCIKVRVMDHTDSATFVIFDKDASQLFDTTCAEMVQGMQIAGSVGVIPPQLQGLLEKYWLFKVEAKANHNPRFERSYRVRKICTDAAIIHQFKSKWDKEEAVFLKTSNEIGSLSTLKDNSNDVVMVGGSTNILFPVYENTPGSSLEGKEKIFEGTPVQVSQDLLDKFTMAAVDLGENSDANVFSNKTESVEKDNKFTAVINVEESAAVINVEESTAVINLEETVEKEVNFERPKVQRKKSVAKRVSPTNAKEDEDDSTPLKLLKRSVKIEKIA